ncbi:hypothetical protein H0X09_00825 [Candidatus Saccharibacteria bacterium]|nr:hypothetical protein [Candidatus Saccharibacteria bacterium]
MIAINHALTGGIVAISVSKPILALPAALASHFFLDMLPHWDYKVPSAIKYRPLIIGMDILVSTIAILFLGLFLDVEYWLFALGALLGVLPDIMWLPYIFFGRPTPYDKKNILHTLRRFHFRIQWSESASGLFVELGWLFMLVVLLVNLGK